MVRHVVLIDETAQRRVHDELGEVAGALKAQVEGDFAEAWGVRATVTAASGAKDGAWPIRVRDRLPMPAGGVHLDKDHKPYAEVLYSPEWTTAASHELLEMLVDPYGQRLVRGPDIDPDSDSHLVEYLVEVCDPCEVFTYEVEGVTVSDFVTPEYYNAHGHGRVDDLGRLHGPYEVPAGCYLSWIDPADNRWHQKRPDGSFVTAAAPVDPNRNPRDDRDAAFADPGRHDLGAILARHAPRPDHERHGPANDSIRR